MESTGILRRSLVRYYQRESVGKFDTIVFETGVSFLVCHILSESASKLQEIGEVGLNRERSVLIYFFTFIATLGSFINLYLLHTSLTL